MVFLYAWQLFPLPLSGLFFLLDPFHRRGRVLDRKFCLSVCPFVCPSSLFPSPNIWWFTACKPYIFWNHITLATTIVLFWPSTQYTDPVAPSTNQYCLILSQYLQVSTSTALYWPSTTPCKPVFERISGLCSSTWRSMHIRGRVWPGLPVILFLGNELVRRASQPRRAARQQGDPFHHHHHCHHDDRLRHYHHHHHPPPHHPCNLTMKRLSLYPL